jgi:hypothetical protein
MIDCVCFSIHCNQVRRNWIPAFVNSIPISLECNGIPIRRPVSLSSSRALRALLRLNVVTVTSITSFSVIKYSTITLSRSWQKSSAASSSETLVEILDHTPHHLPEHHHVIADMADRGRGHDDGVNGVEGDSLCGHGGGGISLDQTLTGHRH